MKLYCTMIVAGLTLAFSIQTTAASIDYVSQSRIVFVEVDANGSFDDGGGEVTAPDFGVFDETVSALASAGGITITATADQFSQLLPDSITAMGSANGSITGGSAVDTRFAFADNGFSVNFELLDDEQISITGLVSHSGDPNAVNPVTLRLTEVGGSEVIQFSASGGDTPIDFQTTLFASEYQLLVSAAFEFDTEQAVSAGYDVSLSIIPEPATVLPLALASIFALRRRRRKTIFAPAAM